MRLVSRAGADVREAPWMIRTDDPTRRSELAKIHLAKKQLALDDNTYRLIVYRVSQRVLGAGHESAGTLPKSGRRALIEELKRMGFIERAPREARADRDLSQDAPQIRKLRACWLDLKQAGLLRDPSERALRSFVKRETGVEVLGWLTPEQCKTVIESLKRWLKRERSEDAGTRDG